MPYSPVAISDTSICTSYFDLLVKQAEADNLEALATARPSEMALVGIDPVELRPNYENSTGLTALIVLTLVAAALFSSSVVRALRKYIKDLWTLRSRPNVFDENIGVSLPAALLLSLIFVVFGGIIIYNAEGVPEATTFGGVAASMALVALYFIFQLCAYNVVAYAFTTREGHSQWLSGFMAVQSYTGLLWIVPAVLLVYVPGWQPALLAICAVIYLAGRILFVGKGIRIFYTKISSIVYFILYLCTLEIIPVLAVYAALQYILRGTV